MEKVAGKTIMDHLHWRYAVKKFDSTRKISSDDWHVLEESLRLAPSSYGLQPWHFICVQSMDVRKQLTPVSWGQQQIEHCSHLVVITHLRSMNEAYVDRYTKSMAETRGVPSASLKGYRDVMVANAVTGQEAQAQSQWMARQAYLAMGSFMTVAALLQIDVCPMEGIDAAQYDSILNLNTTDYRTLAVLAAGYRAADDQLQHAKKVRFPKHEIMRVV